MIEHLHTDTDCLQSVSECVQPVSCRMWVLNEWLIYRLIPRVFFFGWCDRRLFKIIICIRENRSMFIYTCSSIQVDFHIRLQVVPQPNLQLANNNPLGDTHIYFPKPNPNNDKVYCILINAHPHCTWYTCDYVYNTHLCIQNIGLHKCKHASPHPHPPLYSPEPNMM